MAESSSQFEYIAFGDFIAELRRHGFVIGVDHYVLLQKLLESLGENASNSDLRTLLCPLFATSEKQQKLFYYLFDARFRDVEIGRWLIPPPPPTPVSSEGKTPLGSGRWVTAGLLALIALAAAVLWQERGAIFSPRPAPIPTISPVASPSVGVNSGKSPILIESPNPAGNTQPPPPSPRPSSTPTLPIGERIRLRDWILSHPWLARLLAFLGPPLIALIGLSIRWGRRRLVLLRARLRKPPFAWPLRVNNSDHYAPDHFSDFPAITLSLRRRRVSDEWEFDLPATITATVNAAGYTSFRFRPLSRIPEYLFLVDRGASQDHFADWCEELLQALASKGVSYRRFYFNGDPRICREPGEKRESSLADLHRRFPFHRLVLLGNGRQLLDPITGELHDWTALFQEWPDRALLSSADPGWNRWRERTLASQFLVLPANLEGWKELAVRFELPLLDEAPFRGSRSLAPEPPDIDFGVQLEKLRNYLGPRGYLWLCACAVYPQMQLDLTLGIGRVIGISTKDEEIFWRLLRLRWFREGRIPDRIRQKLVRELARQPEEAVVREFVIQVLKVSIEAARNGSKGERRSFAHDERRMEIVVQEAWLARGNRKRLRDALARIGDLPREEVRRDATLLALLSEEPHSNLAIISPSWLRRKMYPEGISYFGVKWNVLMGVAVFIGIIALGGLETWSRLRRERSTAVMASVPSLVSTPTPNIGNSPTPLQPTSSSATLSPSPRGNSDSAPPALPMASPVVGPVFGPILQPSTSPRGPIIDLGEPRLSQFENDMKLITGGSFLMEGLNGSPSRQVTIKSFLIGKYEVTQEQWKLVMGENNNPSIFKGDKLPVEYVNWNEAKIFCQNLSKMTGLTWRLPTEAEWEYAARAGSMGREAYGGALREMGWFSGNAGNRTQPVGTKKPNPWGLYDMFGNVREWCEDDWHDGYSGAPSDGRAWIDAEGRSANRVTRGGGCHDESLYFTFGTRYRAPVNLRADSLGFRLARDAR